MTSKQKRLLLLAEEMEHATAQREFDSIVAAAAAAAFVAIAGDNAVTADVAVDAVDTMKNASHWSDEYKLVAVAAGLLHPAALELLTTAILGPAETKQIVGCSASYHPRTFLCEYQHDLHLTLLVAFV